MLAAAKSRPFRICPRHDQLPAAALLALPTERKSTKSGARSWGEILDAGERKPRFFQEQLNYQATDDRVTQHLRESYSHFIPDVLAQPHGAAPKTEPVDAAEQEE